MRDRRKQLNVRVAGNVHVAVDRICNRLRYTKDQVGEVAYLSLLNSTDPEIIARRQKIEAVVKEMEFPFNYPERQFAGISA